MRENSGERLGIGKLSIKDLLPLLSQVRPVRRSETYQGPYPGEDAAIIRLPCCDLALHTDPITEAETEIGWLSIHVAANDVATTGACPAWASVTVLAPEGSTMGLLAEVIIGIRRAAEELGIDIVGGHTEVSPGLAKHVVVATVMGITCPGCALRTGDARPGDIVIYAGYAGAEGTGILARDFRSRLERCGLGEEVIAEALRIGASISIVRPACALARSGLARSMHDATEGGALGALVELALASGYTVVVEPDRIPVHPATRALSECLGIDPLRLIGSGSFVAVVPQGKEVEALKLLDSLGMPASVVGHIRQGGPRVELPGGERIYEPPRDEISRVWESDG
ncbi:MAG: AIR synthase family protein [Desulfurococcales archaeon]|nr:AIR synthase family protein [Desulfurococcales archaeon]